MSVMGGGSFPNRDKDTSRNSPVSPLSSRKHPEALDLSRATAKTHDYEASGLVSPRKEKLSPSTPSSTASDPAQRLHSRGTFSSNSSDPSPPNPADRDPRSSSSSPRKSEQEGGALPRSDRNSQPYNHHESELLSPKFNSKPERTLMQDQKLGTARSSTGMVLARNIKQTMRSDTFVHCYRINESSRDRQVCSKDEANTIQEGPIGSLIRSTSDLAHVGFLTDYRTYLILFSRSKDCEEKLGDRKDGVSLTKLAVPPVKWSHILQFLHSTEDANEQPYKNVLLNVVNVVVGQWHSAKGPWTSKAMSLPLFEVQGKAVKAIEGSSINNGKQSVATVMQKYLSCNAGNLRGLDKYLKGLRIQVSQPQKQSSSNRLQLQKTIRGLARPDDGHGSSVSWPPQVTKFGAGSKEVSFYFNASSRDRKKATVTSSKLHSQYKTVARYFWDKNQQEIKEPDLPLVNVGTRSKPTYYPPELCELVASPDSKNCSALSFGDITAMFCTANVPKLANSYDGKSEIRFPGLKMSLANSLSDCQIGIKPQSLHLPSRVRFGPKTMYPSGETDTSSGTWKDKKLTLTPCEKDLKVAVLMIGPKQWLGNEQISQNVENFRNHLKTHNISMDEAVEKETVYIANCRFKEDVQGEIAKKVDLVVRNKANAILVVLPFEMKLLYNYVKRQCDIKSGIHSICVTSPRFVCNNDRFFLHLALKLNLKTGGTNQVLKSVKQKILNLKATMVVGVQIMLPPKQAASSAKGFIATVASSDNALSHWPAQVQVLENKPLNDLFFALLEDRMKAWNTPQAGPQNGAHKQQNAQKQQELRTILIYHSGPAHKACLDAISKLKERYPKVKVTLIEVFQDHKADVQLPPSLQDAKNERTITRSAVIVRTMEADKTWEFILHGHTTGKTQTRQSESPPPKVSLSKPPPKRKALPVRYSVVHDDIFSSTKVGDGAREELEDLTHDMSYLAGCSTSVVSSTLPIYYVGLLCNRIKSYVRP